MVTYSNAQEKKEKEGVGESSGGNDEKLMSANC